LRIVPATKLRQKDENTWDERYTLEIIFGLAQLQTLLAEVELSSECINDRFSSAETLTNSVATYCRK
jgi:hypothetical protein